MSLLDILVHSRYCGGEDRPLMDVKVHAAIHPPITPVRPNGPERFRLRRRVDSMSHQYILYGRNFPLITIRTRSPLGSVSREISMEKSMALMMPSPNSSWISALIAIP